MVYKNEAIIGTCIAVLVGGAYYVSQRHSITKAPQTKNAEKLLAMANQLYAQGEVEKALYVYADILQTDSDSTGVIYNFGLCLYKLGKIEQAIGVFSELLDQEPAHTLAYYHRGRALHEIKDFNNALADFNKVVELAPDSITLRIEMAKMSSEQRTPHGYAFATNQLAWAIKHNPENYDLVLELASVQKNNGHIDEARRIYNALLTEVAHNESHAQLVSLVKKELSGLAHQKKVIS